MDILKLKPLYARGSNENIKEYIGIIKVVNSIVKLHLISSVISRNGISRPTIHTKTIESIEQANKLLQSKYNNKKKLGYTEMTRDVGLANIRYNAYERDIKYKDDRYYKPDSYVEQFYSKLNVQLPIYNLANDLHLKPSLCKPFVPEKVSYPRLGQPKLNGNRATLRWEKLLVGKGLFAEMIEKAVIRRKNGDEIVMPHITDNLSKEMFYHHNTELVYDGELYKHGMPLNEINSRIPVRLASGRTSKTKGDPKDLNFNIFDLAIEDIEQTRRLFIAKKMLDANLKFITNELYRNVYSNNISMLEHIIIKTDKKAEEMRDRFIHLGYEGIVLRDPDATYQFDKRTSSMWKLKRKKKCFCEILDIILKTEDSIRSYISFVLKNDLNSKTFECTPIGKAALRDEYLENKDKYIGHIAVVEYYERSGVKKTPFHSNVIDVEFKT